MNILTQLAQQSATNTVVDSGTAAIIVGSMMVAMLLFAVIAYIIGALLFGRIFKKAGIPAWIAWVPFYNNWKLLEIGGQQGFWAVLAIIPVVNIVSSIFMLIAMYHIGLKLGKSGSFVLWAIFFPIVWLAWLAFDASTWKKSLGAPSIAVEHTT